MSNQQTEQFNEHQREVREDKKGKSCGCYPFEFICSKHQEETKDCKCDKLPWKHYHTGNCQPKDWEEEFDKKFPPTSSASCRRLGYDGYPSNFYSSRISGGFCKTCIPPCRACSCGGCGVRFRPLKVLPLEHYFIWHHLSCPLAEHRLAPR